jgi:hypothetical protein
VLAGVTALAVASPAHAQNGFPDYRQAAADQYPTQPPPGNTGSGSEGAPPSGGGGNEQTGGSSGKPRPVHHGTTGAKQHQGGTVSPSSTGGNAPVAVPTKPVPAAKGSLPFTGSDLSGLVVLALVLIAAGLFVGAVARATRRRRRHVPA